MKLVGALFWVLLAQEARAAAVLEAADEKELANDISDFWHRFVQYDASLPPAPLPTSPPAASPRPTNVPGTPRPTLTPSGGSPTSQGCEVAITIDCVTSPSADFPNGRACNAILPPVKSCAGGPLDTVQFTFTPATCDESRNGQATVAICSDEAPFPTGTDSVVIECSANGDDLAVDPVVVSADTLFAVSKPDGSSLPSLITCSFSSEDGDLLQTVTLDVSGTINLNLNDSFGAAILKSCDERTCVETLNYSYDLVNQGSSNMQVVSVNRTISDGITSDNIDLVSLVSPNPLAPGQTVSIEDVFIIDACSPTTYEVDVAVNASSPDSLGCAAEGSYDFTVVSAPTLAPTPVPASLAPSLPPVPGSTPRPSPAVTPRPTLAPVIPPVMAPVIPPTLPTAGDVCDLDFTISCEVDGVDCTAIPAAVDLCTERPTSAEMVLNGGNCNQSYSVQIYMPDKFSCTDIVPGGVPTTEGTQVYVVVTALNDSSIVYTSQYVAVGDTFPLNNGGEPFAADQNITFYSSDQIGPATQLQTVKYQSSCSQNLYLLDRFGAAQVVEWTNNAQGTVSAFSNATFNVELTVPDDIAGSSITLTSFFAVTNFGVFNFTDDVAGQALAPGAKVQVTFVVTLDMTQPRRYTILAELTGVTDTGNECQGSAFYNFSAGIDVTSKIPTQAPAAGPSKGGKGKKKDDKKGKDPKDDKKGKGGKGEKKGKGTQGKAGKESPPGKEPPAGKEGPTSKGKGSTPTASKGKGDKRARRRL